MEGLIENSRIYISLIMADLEHKVSKLQTILKLSLEECINLARKKIRSKKGLSDLQNLLVDYHEDAQLASIILEVIRLIASYEAMRHEEQEQKDVVSTEEYNNLEQALQKYESSVREHIRVQQQLKIYCDEIQQKNKELEASNEELLKSTKQMITALKRDNQKLIEENGLLKSRTRDQREEFKEQPVLNSSRKGRKTGEGPSLVSGRQDSSGNWQQQSAKNRKSSLSAMRSVK